MEGLPKVTKENTEPARFGPVKVWAGSEWYPRADGQIRNLNIETKDSTIYKQNPYDQRTLM